MPSSLVFFCLSFFGEQKNGGGGKKKEIFLGGGGGGLTGFRAKWIFLTTALKTSQHYPTRGHLYTKSLLDTRFLARSSCEVLAHVFKSTEANTLRLMQHAVPLPFAFKVVEFVQFVLCRVFAVKTYFLALVPRWTKAVERSMATAMHSIPHGHRPATWKLDHASVARSDFAEDIFPSPRREAQKCIARYFPPAFANPFNRGAVEQNRDVRRLSPLCWWVNAINLMRHAAPYKLFMMLFHMWVVDANDRIGSVDLMPEFGREQQTRAADNSTFIILHRHARSTFGDNFSPTMYRVRVIKTRQPSLQFVRRIRFVKKRHLFCVDIATQI